MRTFSPAKFTTASHRGSPEWDSSSWAGVTETSHTQTPLCSSLPNNQAGQGPNSSSQFLLHNTWSTSMNGEGLAPWNHSSTHPNDYDPWNTQEPKSTSTGARLTTADSMYAIAGQSKQVCSSALTSSPSCDCSHLIPS